MPKKGKPSALGIHKCTSLHVIELTLQLGKKKNKTADHISPEITDMNPTASVAAPQQAEIQIVPTVPRRAATMEPPRSRGLPLPQPPRPSPLVEISRDLDIEGTVVRPVSPQRNNGLNGVTTTTTTSSTANTTTATTVSTRQLRRVVENNTVVIQKRGYQRPLVPETNAKPNVTDFTLEFYLRYISDERLIRMPDRDSAWDRVLHASQFFGLHISEFGDRVDAFINGQTSNALIHGAKINGLVNGAAEHDTFFNGKSVEAFFNGQKNIVSINRASDLVSAALASSHALLEVCLPNRRQYVSFSTDC